MTQNKSFIPSLLIPEIFKPALTTKGFLPDLIGRISENGFYQALEIAPVYDQKDRERIKQLVTTRGLTLTMWMTNIIDEKQLDLSSPDHKKREADVKIFLDYIYLAKACGASNIALISGPFHGVKNLTAATSGFIKSLKTICAEAAKYQLKVLVEPLDRIAHKRKFIGPTDELVEIIKEVQKAQPNIAIAFDTAHAALNDEKIETALSQSFHYTDQIHLSNAVLEKGDELYGDNHMIIGEPGFLTQARIDAFLQDAKRNGYLQNGGMRVSVEMRTPADQNPYRYEEIAKNILAEALQQLK